MEPNWFLDKTKDYLPETIRIRRYLHQHPELSFEEKNTASFIEETLSSYGISSTRIGNTGVVALIEGTAGKGKIIALRADTDALPIKEAGDRVYKSLHDGVMHACGHDAHTASLISVARILTESTEHWKGQVKIIFQPAEEKFPGGASILIKEGVLKNPSPEIIIGQHVAPELERGKLGFKSGPFMASADEIYITVQGKSGHGAMPHTTRDTILIASHIIVALQQIVSRNNNPLTPSVLTMGKIQSTGGATNIIPGEVKMEGTFRTFDESWRKEAKQLIRKLCEGIAESMGGHVEIDIKDGYPVVLNDENLIGKLKEYAIAMFGADTVVDLPMRTTAEDFGYYSHVLPAAFYRIGTARPGHMGEKKIHTPDFDIDEEALVTSVAFMSYVAVKYCSEQ